MRLRGGFEAHPQFNINDAVYFSALSTASPADSDRFAGGRAGIFVPHVRLEIGGSFQHLLQQERSNPFGFHAIWQPPALPLDIRAEYAHSKRGSGYWVESAYRLSQLAFLRNEMRRVQLVARMQRFSAGILPSDSLPAVNTKQSSFLEGGLNLQLLAAMTILTVSCSWAQNKQPTARAIEILADHDSRYKIEGQKQPVHLADNREES